MGFQTLASESEALAANTLTRHILLCLHFFFSKIWKESYLLFLEQIKIEIEILEEIILMVSLNNGIFLLRRIDMINFKSFRW